MIAAELGKPETTAERREALLSGEAKPVVVKNGQPAMLPETIKRLGAHLTRFCLRIKA